MYWCEYPDDGREMAPVSLVLAEQWSVRGSGLARSRIAGSGAAYHWPAEFPEPPTEVEPEPPADSTAEAFGRLVDILMTRGIIDGDDLAKILMLEDVQVLGEDEE